MDKTIYPHLSMKETKLPLEFYQPIKSYTIFFGLFKTWKKLRGYCINELEESNFAWNNFVQEMRTIRDFSVIESSLEDAQDCSF